MERKYGWKQDSHDSRDRIFAQPRMIAPAKLPPLFKLHTPPPLDQGQLGSCVWNAISGAHLIAQVDQRNPATFRISRLMGYYETRRLEGTLNEDGGCQIRNAFKVLAKHGVCREMIWPYNIRFFTTQPPAQCYADGLNHQALVYSRVPQTIAALKNCLHSGRPVVFGFTVYESFALGPVERTGIMTMPEKGETNYGGHCVLMVGWDDAKQSFLCQNSYGRSWGAKGYFYMPYKFATAPLYCSDHWVLTTVE